MRDHEVVMAERIITDVDHRIQEWLGVSTYLILVKLGHIEEKLVALADDVTALSGAVAALQTAVNDIGARIAANTVTPEETAAIQTATTDINNAAAALAAILPA